MSAGKEEKLNKIEQFKQQEADERMSIPNWLIEVLEWIKRTEMADSSLPTSCLTFKLLCWPKLHGNIKPYKIGYLEFPNDESNKVKLQKEIKYANSVSRYEMIPIPIPAIRPPDYIIGFETIEFRCLNTQILEFIEKIAHLIDEINLTFYDGIWERTDKGSEKIGQMHYLIAMFNGKIFGLNLFSSFALQNVKNYFYDLLGQVQFLSTDGINLDWLTTPPKNDAKQKIYITCFEPYMLNLIKEEFLNATHASNYLIIFYAVVNGQYEDEEFTLENKQTGEILSYYYRKCPSVWEGEDDVEYPLIARYPKGEDHWKETGEQKYWENFPETELIVNIQQPLNIKANYDQQHERTEESDPAPAFFFVCFMMISVLAILIVNEIYKPSVGAGTHFTDEPQSTNISVKMNGMNELAKNVAIKAIMKAMNADRESMTESSKMNEKAAEIVQNFVANMELEKKIDGSAKMNNDWNCFLFKMDNGSFIGNFGLSKQSQNLTVINYGKFVAILYKLV